MSHPTAPASAPASASRNRLRWIGAGLGTAVATLDALGARALGLAFEINGVDMTLAVWAYLALSLGGLGFALGWLIELRRSERQQAAALSEARERLARNGTLAALGQLAGTVAHEVRNPLAVIRSMVQTAREDAIDGLTDAASEGLGVALDEIDRLDRVIDGVLALARPPTPRPDTVSTLALLDRVRALGDRLVAEKGLRLLTDGADSALDADPDLMCQALLDLVANAAQLAPPGSPITLKAEAADGRVRITVDDHGPGVPAEIRPRVFEPFFTTRPDGTGLGLAVVRQIVRAHGGSVAVDDAPGGGARFVIELPSADAGSTASRQEAA